MVVRADTVQHDLLPGVGSGPPLTALENGTTVDRRLYCAVLATAAALTLSACGSDAEASPGGSDAVFPATDGDCVDCDVAAGELDADQAESPATAGPYEWPDGVRAEVLSVTPAPDDLGFGSSHEEFDAAVLITVEFTNTGTSTLSWGSAEETPDWQLFYGANRYEADGFAYDDAPELPSQLRPGTSAQWTVVSFLPATELDDLALAVTPEWNEPAYPSWTFTGVEELLAS